MYHQPVLLKESVDGLLITPAGVYVDATFGSGGHTREILRRLGDGKVIGFDQDPDALANTPDDDRFIFINENFRYLRNFLRLNQVNSIDGLIADLGISSWQIDTAERGFSTRQDGRLDMRMDKEQDLDARKVINSYPEEDLVRIFHEFGEIEKPERLARQIILERASSPIETTLQLTELLRSLAPRGKENQFFAKVFQAIRMEVNDELSALKALLTQSSDMLNPGGRLVFISYHSLEDRIIKNYFRSGNFDGELHKDFFGNIRRVLEPVNRKVISPEEEEIRNNPRARSAKLRIAEKKESL